jgi:integrase
MPTEQELDALIAGSGKKFSTLLQLLKEIGMRVGEARRLHWTDVDFQKLQKYSANHQTLLKHHSSKKEKLLQ